MPTWPGHTGVLVGHRNGQHWDGLEGIKMPFGERGQTAKQTLPASTDRKYPRGESTGTLERREVGQEGGRPTQLQGGGLEPCWF